MANHPVSERLDRAVEAVLVGGERSLPRDRVLVALARVAAGLLGLPTEEFRGRLRSRLLASAGERTKPAGSVRKGFHTVTLYLAVADAERLVDFVEEAFDATETLRTRGSQGGLHAEVRIGDSMVMIGGQQGMTQQTPSAIHIYVEDTDATYRRALKAGATSLHEPVDQAYGERGAAVRDPFGNLWYIATYQGSDFVPEGLQTVNPYLHARGTDAVIAFLKEALGAEEIERAQSPRGVVMHAKVRIGDSVVEMGEARGPYQPMPTAIYLYVEDVDALYHRAVLAGAISQQEPADQPYGDRVASLKDPFGVTWYIATHRRNSA